jgi:hypothetical protein
MSIFQSPEIIANTPAQQGHEAGSVFAFCNSIDILANPTAADTYEFGLVPAGAKVIGGWIYAPDLDTDASETLNMDIGWQANGVEAGNPDGFGNLDVLIGDVVAGNSSRIVGLQIPLQGVLQVSGAQTFTNDTVIEMVCNVTAAADGLGVVTVYCQYLCR